MEKKKYLKYIVLLVVLLATFLRFYKLSEGMTFIGDQAWFYLSAKDMIFSGKIPLVGITSSHTWLHQGPLWTYVLAVVFLMFGFDPVIPGYFVAFVDVITILVLYFVASMIFSREVGVYSAILYTVSPFIVMQARMPYHSSLIPICILLFVYCVYKWLKGEVLYFPFILFLGGILYNLELSTVPINLIFLVLIVYGYKNKKKWILDILKDKALILRSFLFLFIPFTPILVYDATHGFPQTIKFAGWIIYSIIRGVVNINQLQALSGDTTFFITQSYSYIQNIYFVSNSNIAVLLFVVSLCYIIFKSISKIKLKQKDYGLFLLTSWLGISLFAYIFTRTPSGAYLPIFTSGLFMALSYLLATIRKKSNVLAYFLLSVIIFTNISWLYENVYDMRNQITLYKREEIAKSIVKSSQEVPYILQGVGQGSQFSSFIMNYEYLTWWMDHPPSKNNAKLKFIVKEEDGKVELEKIVLK